MNELPLADLDAFAAVAHARSFRTAAKKRGVSASALSEALRRLESRLGVRLLNRTTRSVTVTEAGRRLLERLAPALGEIAGALEQVASERDNPAGTLRLNVPTIVAREILPPIVGPFLAAHPAIALEVTAEDGFIDVLAAGFDAGVRYEERLEKDMIAIPIGPRVQRYVTAAAPAYLARHGVPQHPRDLLDHATIRHRFQNGIALAWEFGEDEAAITVSPPATVLANSIDLEISAAVAGHGIIRTFEELVMPEMRTGRLVPILEDWVTSFPGPYLYYAGRRHLPAPLRAFVDFLKARQRQPSQ
ncbi:MULTISPECIES: LysR family transcriptional regulator [Sinorhizobium]|uniref:LysR family transcriptional regulator n=2 Tax=Sinorhizobium TaxID=28105 RepID=A0A2S3YNZ6_9HYPH|nr:MULTISPECIES: LysR family transcriptional regulator [Sinorhizobium]AUX76511.1 LysR family transcriptional regulator protein [Sinorhizobium fredii]PDT42748.1 LysR family transcriptional regulator [Sinorhizobium sp. FG01]PDT54946.1 LysR family transcriptional regulator [Sinorhizobium sp. NG07B]POH31989.1 LysR family transcriptional regulator [Sinorhizobium americanum]POH32672.1 LysR family transcriptional regulator [Sinorhizobium americanum]